MSRPAVDPETLPEVLTLAEAASLLRMSEDAVSALALAGHIPGRKLGVLEGQQATAVRPLAPRKRRAVR